MLAIDPSFPSEDPKGSAVRKEGGTPVGEDAEDCGGFAECEQALVTQSLFAAAELVFVADVADDEPVEGAAFAGGQAAVVEDAGDLGVSVVIE